MNESRFDAALKAAHPTPSEPTTLDLKVRSRLDHHGRSIVVRRRVALSLAATGAVALGLFALPAVEAQASLLRITSALDGAPRVVIDTYSVDEQGRKTPIATTIIAGGDESYREASGHRESISKGDKTYTFDPTIHAYIVSERRGPMRLKMSELLGPAGEFSFDKRAAIEHVVVNGRNLIRATVQNQGLPERYIIEADPQTELPVDAQVESLERGAWRLREVLDFRYDPSASIPGPDLRHYRVTTREEADAAFTKSMEGQTLAEIKFGKRRLVVRSVEVAQDGTVFVAYQAGEKAAMSWSGYGLRVSDSLNTRYLRVGDMDSDMRGPFNTPDGKVELEVFTPEKPLTSTIVRTIHISTQIDPKGRFVRMIRAGVNYPDGHTVFHWQPNYQGAIFGKETVVSLLSLNVSEATCTTHPAWAETLNFMSFGNSILAEMSKAGTRGDAALEDKRWDDAVDYYNEELRRMREFEQKGYGPWDHSRALDKLDQARSHTIKP